MCSAGLMHYQTSHTETHTHSNTQPVTLATQQSRCQCVFHDRDVLSVCVCVFGSIIGLGMLWVSSALTESFGSVLGSFNAFNALSGDLDNIHTHF